MSNIHSTMERIKREGLIPIIRGDFPLARMVEIAAAVRDAGIGVLEVTLNSRGALEVISTFRRQFGDTLLVGAGTVRVVEQVDAALAAGAQFIVAPNFDALAVARSQERDILHLPGVFTPTEAETAFRAGCRVVKLFPADAMGPTYLKALRAPLNDIEFVPTGGVSVDNLADYVRAGAVAVGIGSALITGPQQPIAEVAERAAALRAAWEAAHA